MTTNHRILWNFTSLVDPWDGGPKQAVMLLGSQGEYKLPSFGVALAAEALKNLGFDVAKPDRHLTRAVGSFGLVRINRWKRTLGGESVSRVDIEREAGSHDHRRRNRGGGGSVRGVRRQCDLAPMRKGRSVPHVFGVEGDSKQLAATANQD